MDEELIESMREEAIQDADTDFLRDLQKLVDDEVQNPRLPSLKPVKSLLRKTNKSMRTCSYYLCDKCNQPIINCDDGYIFHGNVYVANPLERGGLIGNNFPNVTPDTSIHVEDVEENVFCHKCVMEVLGLNRHYEPRRTLVEKAVTRSDESYLDLGNTTLQSRARRR